MNKNNKSFLAVISGHIIEHYNVTLYGFYAVILSTVFFPEGNETNTILASFAAFAVGCAIKPFGGIFFGHIGDRYGRRKALLIAIFLSSIPTLIIGFIPSYQYIGIIAPIILIVCLSLQNFSFAGELIGSGIYIKENTTNAKVGTNSGIMLAVGFSGALIATTTSLLFNNLSLWCAPWRLSFVLGGLIGLIVFFCRTNILETKEYNSVQNKINTKDIPIIQGIKKFPLNFLCTAIIGGFLPVNLYLSTIFLNAILTTHYQVDNSTILFLNTFCTGIWVIFLPIMGKVSDLISQRKIMLISSMLTILIGYTLFSLVNTDVFSLKNVMLFQVIMSLIGAAYAAPCLVFLSSLFPTNLRYSTMSLSFNTGQIILGSSAPLIAEFLANKSNYILGPYLYLASTAFLSIIALLSAKTYTGK